MVKNYVERCENMKKNFKFGVLIFVFAFLFNTSAFASSSTHTISELGLDITIPSDYKVITKDTPANASVFSDLGRTKSDVIEQFEASNIYLNAISNVSNEEIVITMTNNGLSDFNLVSDFTLDTLASALVKQYTDYGITVSEYEVYQHSQAKFIKVYFSDTANSVYGLQYYTTYDDKAMNFTLRSYKGSITSTQENTIKSVVDSIKFEAEPLKAEPGEDTNAFIYTDVDTGLTFTVPANWKQEEMSKERNFIDAKFVSTKEDGNVIIYGSSDMWEGIPASERVGYSRADLNNSAFTKSDIAEMYNTTADKISLVEYNGIEYYFGEMTGSSEVYGLDLTMTMTQVVHIDNGWMYMFQFAGTSNREYFADFEKLMNSVQFSSASNVAGVGSLGLSSDDVDNSSNSVVALIVGLLVVGVIVAVVLYNKNNSKTTTAESNVFDNMNDLEKADDVSQSVICVKCGQALPLDSEFCHICGTKILKTTEETET